MSNLSLKEVVSGYYNDMIEHIRGINIELERESFGEMLDHPVFYLFHGASFEENFRCFKKIARKSNETEVSGIFNILQELFLFSYGHDMGFKTKLMADYYVSVPMDELIYPLLEGEVASKYNDLSVMPENPNYEANTQGIFEIVKKYFDLQSLLYMLYCNEFNFCSGWEKLSPGNASELIEILNASGMTVGDFLHALIDFKGGIMRSILGEIGDPLLRAKYMGMIDELIQSKHADTNTFANLKLPVTFFLNHTINDALDIMFRENPSPIILPDGDFSRS